MIMTSPVKKSCNLQPNQAILLFPMSFRITHSRFKTVGTKCKYWSKQVREQAIRVVPELSGVKYIFWFERPASLVALLYLCKPGSGLKDSNAGWHNKIKKNIIHTCIVIKIIEISADLCFFQYLSAIVSKM